jgi:hypothetical protein
MDFSLHSGDTEERFTGEEARYYVDEKHGLLHVTTGDGKQRTYSPSGWDYIEEAVPSGPNFYSI